MIAGARSIASLALLAAALAPSVAAAADDPALQPPFGGQQPPPLKRVASDARPAGFELSAGEATRFARTSKPFGEELAAEPSARAVPYLRGENWQIELVSGRGEDSERLAFAVVEDATGDLREAWNDQQLGSELARGYDGAIAQTVNSPWLWIGLSLLFCLPFVDPRRPFRLLHLDLLALVGLGASLALYNQAEITASVALTLPVLGYLLGRSLWTGLRPQPQSGPLVPIVGVRVLAILALALGAGRIGLNVADSRVIDVGVAGVVGADRIADGEELYGGEFSPGLDLRGDVYGPANYLAYAPFEQAFSWEGVWEEVSAAHAAAIVFDLLSAVGLLLLGRRLRAGPEGRALGVALAFAWLSYPFTLYTMNANANDSLVAALGIGALLAVRSAPLRGAAVAVAALAKFGSAATAPLFATGTGERRRRDIAIFSLVFGLISIGLFAPFIPDGGVAEVYERTFGYQASRSSPFSLWGQAPSLEPLQAVARALAVLLAVTVAFVPARRTVFQLAALAAAVTIAVQLTATHWFYFYVVWFLPFFLVASFGETGGEEHPDAQARSV
ncbi:MAG: hypothetical protein H0W09_06820 [Solirubrobacterales bacterium]|nr:hypothetical protein [Solirubrobacterales bacterium]